MSYQVLARKWRPRNFSTLVGQEHVVRALTHALTEQRLHHAYLFTGTRGVGKTTIARILAKSLNCETGLTATPCGKCSACLEIDAGRFVDLLEVDAATNTRVDEMRQLLENAVYAPTRGRFKVYVIDEVHMLSNSAFNAMLKTLEEPPEHVKFILATTDPQKIPVTVLSRCLQFNLKQMPSASIAAHLTQILKAEGLPYETPALALIARSAAGSMRDALSLLDQAIAHGAGQIDEVQVRSMLGAVDQDFLFGILEALVSGDIQAVLAIASDLAIRSISFSATLQDLASLLTRVQIVQCVPAAADDDDPDRVRVNAIAVALSPEFVQLAYQIVCHGRSELPDAPDEYSGFVMALLRLFSFRPASVADVLATLPVRKVAPLSAMPRSEPAVPPVVKASDVAVASPREQEQSARANFGLNSALTAGSPDWHEIVSALNLSGLARELAQNCELRQLSEAGCLLRLPPGLGHLQMKPSPDRLQQALTEFLGRPVAVRIEQGRVEAETPAATAGRERQARQEQARSAIERDSFVRDVVEVFDASLIDSSIKPIV